MNKKENSSAVMKIFMAHTPLQALSVTNIKIQYFSHDDHCLLLWEEDDSSDIIDRSVWKNVLKGKQTRSSTHNTKVNIYYNLALLKKTLSNQKPKKVILFISELLWLCNKVFYAFLKKQFGENLECCFFDEGLHVYVNGAAFSEDAFFKTVLKHGWLTFSGLPNYFFLPKHMYSPKFLKAIYCFYPELLKDCHYDFPLNKLDPKFLSSYLQGIISNSITYGSSKELLFLSQPYNRDIPDLVFRKVVMDMVGVFRKRGIERFYVKTHHADKPEWIHYLVNHLGFIPFQLDKEVAIELYASKLNFEYVVSVSSSALINLPLFGYHGKIVSYGMGRCSKTKKYTQLHRRILPVFKNHGIEILC